MPSKPIADGDLQTRPKSSWERRAIEAEDDLANLMIALRAYQAALLHVVDNTEPYWISGSRALIDQALACDQPAHRSPRLSAKANQVPDAGQE